MAPTKTAKTSSASAGPSLKKVKGENFYRDAKKVKRLKMLTGGKPIRDKNGNIVQAAEFQKGEDETKPGRVQADRRWFGNTRVISQTALDHFRGSLSTRKHDPYSVLLRRNKLPMALLDDAANPNVRKRSHIVETEPFSETFGPKAQRKKPRIEAGTFEELGKLGTAAHEEAERTANLNGVPIGADFAFNVPDIPTHADVIEPIYAKGTSRRIYGELYKVIDSSDVILHVLDARDPLGTMCESVLEYVRKEKAHKQVVLIINKCDLVPNWVTARYIQHLTPRYPTLAFHASPNHSFGKGALIQLLRQFSQLHSDKKQISVGLIGYPNVGKSSVINTIKSSKVCRVAPVPGETKVWQYITLTRKIYLIDCPGIVPASAHDSTTATVLKGVVRVEALATPSEHIPELLKRVKPLYISRTYGIPVPASGEFEAESLLDALARQKGRLLKGGEADLDGVAKVLLSDWTRGRIPYFVSPPERPQELNEREERERRIAKAKGKAKEEVKAMAPEKELRVVKQNIGSIMQKNSFVGDDIRPMDEGDDAGEDEEVDGVEEESEVEGEDEAEEELAWGDVFEEGTQASPAASVQTEGEVVEEWGGVGNDADAEASGSNSDTPAVPVTKEARMKTNKRKATNFYSDSNVKNKNRKKAAHMQALRAHGRRS